MLNLTDEDRALLAFLIPTAQRLSAVDQRALRAWLWQISDRERALLVTWVAHQGPGWIAANIDRYIYNHADV
jgi:hypothetical protein